MDPVTVTALTAALTAAASGAGGEAGKSAWTALTSTTRRIIGRTAPASTALEVVEDATDDPDDLDALATAATAAAEYLLAEARDNPDLATLLHAWYAEHAPPDQASVSQGSSSTTNVVSGTAHVTNLIQARDVSGDITFGA